MVEFFARITRQNYNMKPSVAIANWFNPDVDGVLEKYAQGSLSGFARRVIKSVNSVIPLDLTAKYLGGGDNGHAWLLRNGQVLKLSIDEKEANAANKLRTSGGTHPNITDYSMIVQIGGLPVFVMLQEYAGKPITDPELKEFLGNLPLKSWQIVDSLEDQYKVTGNNAYKQLASGMNWLIDNDVDFIDLNDENVMKSGNTYKIIDMGGGGKVRRPPPMDSQRLLEQKLSLIMNTIKKIALSAE